MIVIDCSISEKSLEEDLQYILVDSIYLQGQYILAGISQGTHPPFQSKVFEFLNWLVCLIKPIVAFCSILRNTFCPANAK